MKLTLIFPRIDKDISNLYYITIYRDKIHNYTGISPLKQFPGSPKQENSEKFINSTFSIHKLDKLDRKKLKTEATHKIISNELHSVVHGQHPYCVKLDWYQKIYINWFHKEYIVQSLDFKKRILTLFIGVVLGSLGTVLVDNIKSVDNELKMKSKQEFAPYFDRTITDEILKTDSIIGNNKSG